MKTTTKKTESANLKKEESVMHGSKVPVNVQEFGNKIHEKVNDLLALIEKDLNHFNKYCTTHHFKFDADINITAVPLKK